LSKKIVNYSGCFVCGQDNPVGLKLDFFYDEGKQLAWTEYQAERQYQGYRDIVHGGIISCLLDEVMVKAIMYEGVLAVTIKLTVEFKQPARIGEKIRAEGWVTRRPGKAFVAEGRLIGKNGQIIATGSGVYYRAEGELAEQLAKSQP
jgi:uncharacterized protein (TIGR00369 family)